MFTQTEDRGIRNLENIIYPVLRKVVDVDTERAGPAGMRADTGGAVVRAGSRAGFPTGRTQA